MIMNRNICFKFTKGLKNTKEKLQPNCIIKYYKVIDKLLK